MVWIVRLEDVVVGATHVNVTWLFEEEVPERFDGGTGLPYTGASTGILH